MKKLLLLTVGIVIFSQPVLASSGSSQLIIKSAPTEKTPASTEIKSEESKKPEDKTETNLHKGMESIQKDIHKTHEDLKKIETDKTKK